MEPTCIWRCVAPAVSLARGAAISFSNAAPNVRLSCGVATGGSVFSRTGESSESAAEVSHAGSSEAVCFA